MIVEVKQTTASIALELLLETKPDDTSLSELKGKFAVRANDSEGTLRAKELLLKMIESAELMIQCDCFECTSNHEIGLTDVPFMLRKALLEIRGWNLLPNFENVEATKPVLV